MPLSHRLLSMLGVLAGAALAGCILPMAVGHADDTFPPGGGGPYETCDGAVCLVMGDIGDNWHYSGIRPLFTDWKADQPYNVVVNGDDGSTVDAGSYDVKIQDYWSPNVSLYQYHYGDFTPNADAPSDLDLGDLGGLSGADIYNASYFGGKVNVLSLVNIEQHGHELSYYITTTGDTTNTMVVDPVNGGSADYIQTGDSAPHFLYDSLFHSFLPEPPDYDIPADPFAGLDFDPGQY